MTDQPRCAATVKARDGQPARPCKRYPSHGSRVCTSHGAAAPQVRRKANERVVTQQLMATVKNMDLEPISDPLTALGVVAAEVLAWKNLLAGRLEQIPPGELRYQTAAGEQLRSEVALYERSMTMAANVLASIAKLNIDERLSRITEAQAERMDMLLAAVFLDLALTPEQQREGRMHLAKRIRSMGGPS